MCTSGFILRIIRIACGCIIIWSWCLVFIASRRLAEQQSHTKPIKFEIAPSCLLAMTKAKKHLPCGRCFHIQLRKNYPSNVSCAAFSNLRVFSSVSLSPYKRNTGSVPLARIMSHCSFSKWYFQPSIVSKRSTL